MFRNCTKIYCVYVIVLCGFIGALFTVVQPIIYKLSAILLFMLLLFGYKHRKNSNSYIFVAGALFLHHCLLAKIVVDKSVDADGLTPFIINAGFFYAPALPDPVIPVLAVLTLTYYFISYNSGVISLLVGGKIFTTFLITSLVSGGVYYFRQVSIERERFYRASFTDPLTGLFTFTYAVKIGQDLLDHGNKMIVIIMNLDNFKNINDTYGYFIGNKVLIQFAGYLRETVCPGAVVARLGGDEFIVLIKQDDAMILPIDRLIDKLNKQEYITDSDLDLVHLAFSYGVAIQDKGTGADIQEMIRVAEKDIYCNKTSQGIGAVIYDGDAILDAPFHDLIHVLAQKDMYTYVHSLHVACYGASLAKCWGLNRKETEDIFLAGWLHDVGKIVIPNEILRKPGKLTDKEYELIKWHVEYGMDILLSFDVSEMVRQAVSNHHERYDGLGYPCGRSQQDIPLAGRILAIADTYSAMTVKRVYRRQLSQAEGLTELKRQEGRQFDPELVEKFIDMLTEKPFQFQTEKVSSFVH
jgi:diguanylate cyclase (GGDEF)-like protein/putative nucleotidyltransferase with HDIG domain